MKISSPGDYLIIPDLHIRKKPGGEDRRSIDAVLKYASDHAPWKGLIFLGDVMDNNTISSHNKGNIRATQGETILEDYSRANDLLDQFYQAATPEKSFLIEGNHDFRSETLVDQQPTLQGLVETENGLKLRERGWEFIRYWSKGELLHVGKASFGHGRYTNEQHAKKHAQRYGRNFYYGHLHDEQSYTVEREGDNEKYEAASLGCLCEYQQDYLQGKPTRWQQAATKISVQKNGFFNRYTIKIFNHSFISPEGGFYRG